MLVALCARASCTAGPNATPSACPMCSRYAAAAGDPPVAGVKQRSMRARVVREGGTPLPCMARQVRASQSRVSPPLPGISCAWRTAVWGGWRCLWWRLSWGLCRLHWPPGACPLRVCTPEACRPQGCLTAVAARGRCQGAWRQPQMPSRRQNRTGPLQRGMGPPFRPAARRPAASPPPLPPAAAGGRHIAAGGGRARRPECAGSGAA